MKNNIPIAIEDYLGKSRAAAGQKQGSRKNPVNNYNKDNKNNKNNKNNCDESLSVCSPSAESKSTEKHIEASKDTQRKDFESTALPEKRDSVSASRTWLADNMIEQAVIQLFFNAEGRTKHNLKIQLKMHGQYIEFICSLTTDLHNFRKFGNHIAQEHQAEIINQALDVREKLKSMQASQKKNVYMGKFRESSGNSYLEGQCYMMPIESRTLGIVWYDNLEHKWNVAIQFHDLQIESSMSADGLTDKQKSVGIKCQHVYYPAIKFKRKSWTERWQAGEL